MENLHHKISSSRRFGQLLYKLLAEKRKSLMIFAGGFIGFWIIIGIYTGLWGSVIDANSYIIYILLAGMICSLAASKMFSEMSKKEGKISVLILPASQTQKFVTRLLLVVPGMIILTIIGYLLYGYTNLLAFGLYNDIWLSLYNPMSSLFSSSSIILSFFFFISLFLLSESFFIFGAIAWPKRSFLKTILAIAALMIAMGFILWLFVKVFTGIGLYIRVTNENAFTWSFITIVTLISVAITYCAFILFKRKTIA